MSRGPAERLYLPGVSAVHGLIPQGKLVALLAFVLIVVSTPREQWWAFGAYAALLAAVAGLAQVPARIVIRRMAVELPFVVFAVLLPWVATGPQTQVLGVSLSLEGLLGAWNLLAKGTLGVVASILVAATTEPRALLLGLRRLHLPALMVQIMSFMLRYADVVLAEMERMRIARESRAFRARDVRQLRAVTASAGALFIRSYERGERVHLAMLSRGYTGALPVLVDAPAGAAHWARSAALPLAALGVALPAWWLS